MNQSSRSSEIILNADGSIYHLGLRPEHICDIILTVGDPERVPLVSQQFDRVDEKFNKREFVSHIGEVSGKRVMVISSGIGTDNVEILLTELHILANYDLSTMQPAKRKSLPIIRIGTSGALHADVPLDSLLVSDYAFGLDALMQFYQLKQPSQYIDYAEELMDDCELELLPYCARADDDLKNLFAKEMQVGNTITTPGFYAPQGREIVLPIRPSNLIGKLRNFSFEGGTITNFEMETAAYYALGSALGHQMISTNAIMANRISNKFSTNPSRTMQKLISTVISKIALL